MIPNDFIHWEFKAPRITQMSTRGLPLAASRKDGIKHPWRSEFRKAGGQAAPPLISYVWSQRAAIAAVNGGNTRLSRERESGKGDLVGRGLKRHVERNTERNTEVEETAAPPTKKRTKPATNGFSENKLGSLGSPPTARYEQQNGQGGQPRVYFRMPWNGGRTANTFRIPG